MRDDLPVCSKCGWYDGYTHADECDPHRGHAADLLIAAVKAELPALRTSKLGHGFGLVTIEVRKNKCSLTLQVERFMTYRIEGIAGLFWLQPLDIESVVRLVCVLAVLDDKLRKKALKS